MILFKRTVTTLFTILLLTTLARSAQSQSIESLLEAAGKELEKAARERANAYVEELKDQVDAPCRSIESSAIVNEFDESRSQTWAVKTVDGRRFQLRQIGIVGVIENDQPANLVLGAAALLDFVRVDQDDLSKRYKVSITYQNLAHGESVVGQILATAFNNTMQNNLPASTLMRVFRIEGRNHDGSLWCLSGRANTVDTIRWIR